MSVNFLPLSAESIFFALPCNGEARLFIDIFLLPDGTILSVSINSAEGILKGKAKDETYFLCDYFCLQWPAACAKPTITHPQRIS